MNLNFFLAFSVKKIFPHLNFPTNFPHLTTFSLTFCPSLITNGCSCWKRWKRDNAKAAWGAVSYRNRIFFTSCGFKSWIWRRIFDFSEVGKCTEGFKGLMRKINGRSNDFKECRVGDVKGIEKIWNLMEIILNY